MKQPKHNAQIPNKAQFFKAQTKKRLWGLECFVFCLVFCVCLCFVFSYITLCVMCPLWLLVSIWFQVYFTPLTGVLFTFPSRYLFTIGLQEYLALPVSSGKFLRATRVSKYSRTATKEISCFRVRDYYPILCIFPDTSANKILCDSSRYKYRCCRLMTPMHHAKCDDAKASSF